MTVTLTTDAARATRGLARLLRAAAGIEELSPCVQSAVSTLAALAGGPEFADAVADGREGAKAVGDDELAGLLDKVLEALEVAGGGSRAPALAA